MRYFSEETVRELMAQVEINTVEELLTQAEINGEDWGERKPIDLNDYPSIEIKEPHGRLVDADANREDFMDTVYSELYSDGDNYRANRIIDAYDNALTIVESNA